MVRIFYVDVTVTGGDLGLIPLNVTVNPDEPEATPKSEPSTMEDLVRGIRNQVPEPMPPRRFGFCASCNVSISYEAFAGCCSVCGRTLRSC